MDPFVRIKQLALSHRIIFSRKAKDELIADALSEDEVIESILNAHRIDKILRSTSRYRTRAGEKLYVIKGLTYSNVLVYTKGRIVKDFDQETFYVLISSKRSF